MKNKIYAVRKGRTTGIFNNWEECKESVNGFKGAEFKSFSSETEAKAYLKNEDLIHDLDKVTAYVDGSYNIENEYIGSGVILIIGEEEVRLKKGIFDPNLKEHRNVAGEVLAAKMAIEYCIEHKIKDLKIYYDYIGIEKWATNEWKTNTKLTGEYKKYISGVKNKINIKFEKVKSHSGNVYNDIADKLAKEATLGK